MLPLDKLRDAANAASAGFNAAASGPAQGEGIDGLSHSLQTLFNELDEKRSLESYVGQISRQLPEPAHGGGVIRPQAKKVALLAIELRRFANAKVGYDPEESVGRMARDLRRAENVIGLRQGRAESVAGHRLLASFEGEGSAFRALTAATEISLLLSQRENVFDEPEPPVVVITFGHVVSGSTTWGARQVNALLGLPVQQLETLIREGSPGDLILSHSFHAELQPTLDRLDVSIAEQRGLISPQPLYPVRMDLAAKITGITAPPVEEEEGAARRSMADLSPGMLLGNRFELLAELGSGRMGVAYKARDREQHELLLLKILKPEIVGDAVQMDRLRGQILQARGIRHPNLLSVHDFGEVEGLPYVAMEFVRAVSLRYLLEQSSRVPLLAGLNLARRICAGLMAAHEGRMVHLGLKPENILVQASGEAKLADLGLALPSQPEESGVVSPYYQAPEQLQGEGVDSRTDLYAFGVVVYEMLTGQPPFTGGTPLEIRNRVLNEEPAAASTLAAEIPPALDQLILRCLAKERDARHSTVADLMQDLESIRL
jgi:serine/threonine-protein kinase